MSRGGKRKRGRDSVLEPTESDSFLDTLPTNVREYLADNNLDLVHNYPDGNCFHSSLAAHPTLFPELFQQGARSDSMRGCFIAHINQYTRSAMLESLGLPADSHALSPLAYEGGWSAYKSGIGANGRPSDSIDFHVAASILRKLPQPRESLFIISLREPTAQDPNANVSEPANLVGFGATRPPSLIASEWPAPSDQNVVLLRTTSGTTGLGHFTLILPKLQISNFPNIFVCYPGTNNLWHINHLPQAQRAIVQLPPPKFPSSTGISAHKSHQSSLARAPSGDARPVHGCRCKEVALQRSLLICPLEVCAEQCPFPTKADLAEHLRSAHAQVHFNDCCIVSRNLWRCTNCAHIAAVRSNHQCATHRASKQGPFASAHSNIPPPIAKAHMLSPKNIPVLLQDAWTSAQSLVARSQAITWDLVVSSQKLHTSMSVPVGLEYRLSYSRLIRFALSTLSAPAPPEEAWKLFFMLPKLLFGRGPDGKFPNKSLTKRRLTLFLHGRLAEVDTFLSFLVPPYPGVPAQQLSKARKAELLVAAKELGRAWSTLESDLAQVEGNSETVNFLKELHPQAQPLRPSMAAASSLEDALPPAATPFSVEDVVGALASSSHSAAPGPSGWRLEHILAASHNPGGGELSTAALLFPVLAHLFHGRVPLLAAPLLYGGNLSAFRKPSGGLRPIAVGDTLIRIMARATAHAQRDRFETLLVPSGQMGVATPSGAETIIHVVRLAMQAHPDWVCLQLDFRNAFNTVSRSLIANELREHHPDLLPYFYARYGQHTVLQVHTGPGQDPASIFSAQGLHQGDPLAPFFFSLALRAAISKLKAKIQEQIQAASSTDPSSARHTELLHLLLAFLDDVTICGPPMVVAEVFRLLMAALNELESGLALNVPKCSLWSPSPTSSSEDLRNCFVHPSFDYDFNPQQLFVPSPDAGIVLLGAPIGSVPFSTAFLMRNAQALAAKLDLVNEISSIQVKYLLLRFCAVPRVSYALRTAHPSATQEMSAYHDNTMLRAFQDFTQTASGNSFFPTLIHLPVKSNGAGISSAHQLGPLAYVASVADALRNFDSPSLAAVKHDIQRWAANISPDAVELWEGSLMVNHVLSTFHRALSTHRQSRGNHAFQEGLVSNPALLPRNAAQLLTSERKLQHRLSKVHHEMTHSFLTENVSEALRAYLLSSRQPGANLCLNLIPSSREMVISNEVFQHFMSSHLLLPLLNNDGLSLCSCRDRHNPNAPHPHIRPVTISHTDNCALGGGTVDRHDALAQTGADFLTASGFHVHSDFRKQGGGLRPDLIVHDFPRPGDSSYVEVCVVNPLANQVVRTASTVPLSAASAREALKINKYKELARENNFNIYTFVAESTGAFGKGIQQVLSIGAANADTTAYTLDTISRTRFPPSFKKFWSQRLAIAFWQGSLQMQKARLRSITQSSLAPLSSHLPRHVSHRYVNPHIPISSSSYTPGAFYRPS